MAMAFSRLQFSLKAFSNEDIKSAKGDLEPLKKTQADEINAEFDRRMKMAKLAIDNKGIESRERIAYKQIIAAQANEPQPQPQPAPQPIPVPVPHPIPVPVVLNAGL